MFLVTSDATHTFQCNQALMMETLWMLQVEATDVYPTKRGQRNGLFRSQIGLNITVSRKLFNYGRIRIKCAGGIEDGILQGISKGSSHHIETIMLPEALKRERTQVFVGKFTKD